MCMFLYYIYIYILDRIVVHLSKIGLKHLLLLFLALGQKQGRERGQLFLSLLYFPFIVSLAAVDFEDFSVSRKFPALNLLHDTPDEVAV